MVLSKITVPESQEVQSCKAYTDKHISLIRQQLNTNVLSMDALYKKMKSLEEAQIINKFNFDLLLQENKELKQEIHVLKVNSKVKQSSLEGF